LVKNALFQSQLLFYFFLKIVWPWADTASILPRNNEPKYIMSVDGTHCRISEPRSHPDTAWFSHKLNKPGLAYTVGLHIYESKIIWISESYKAGAADITMFKEGIMDRIPDGHKVIADKGYRGYSDKLCLPNPFDDESVKDFKNRARSRHEALYKRMKLYQVLEQRFRHHRQRHRTVFTAVCILLQYDFEDGGRPLWDV
jgi:DDE superfamily endonuclease